MDTYSTNMPDRFNMQPQTSSIDSYVLKVIAFVFIIALLGVNLFSYLEDVTEIVSDFMRPIVANVLGFFGYSLAETSKNVIDLSTEGTKAATDIAAGTLKSGLNVTTDVVQSLGTNVNTNRRDTNYRNKSDKVLKDAEKQYHYMNSRDNRPTNAKPNSTMAGGFCYIGEDRGVRTCAQVEDQKMCMSGALFPTHDLCVNPNIRR